MVTSDAGISVIQLKDYQSDKMVILNGRIALDPTDETYIAAQQLEIYVPDLSIPKSTVTAVFQHGMSWSRPMVTALKSWIKNKNTIVVEKPIVLKNAAAEPVLDFLCAYVPKGVRFTPEGMTLTPLPERQILGYGCPKCGQSMDGQVRQAREWTEIEAELQRAKEGNRRA